MNYYKRHLGDFARDCPNLSQGAVGAYTLLLDFYYANERPLPLERDQLVRIARCFTAAERKALDDALSLFDREDDGYHSRRADEEIAAYHAKAEANRENGQKGGRPKGQKAPKGNPQKTQTVSVLEPTNNLSQNPESNSHLEASKPSAYSSTTVDPEPPADDPEDPIPPCPHAEIIALYHSMLPSNPRIKVWDAARQARLRTRWREDPKRQCLDYWQRYFAHVAASPFLTGRVSTGERKPFTPGLEWLVKAENFAKVIEGRYHDRSQT